MWGFGDEVKIACFLVFGTNKVPWGEEQNKTFDAHIEALTLPPILVLVWAEPLAVHRRQ